MTSLSCRIRSPPASSAAIAPQLEQAEIDRSERKPTESLDAVDLYYRAIHSQRRLTRQGHEDALRLARQAISLDPNFAAAYGLILDCYIEQKDQGWITTDDAAAEGKQYALRAIEVGADDAFALARAANFFGNVLKDAGTADVIADQAIAVNPNLSVAWRMRGWVSMLPRSTRACPRAISLCHAAQSSRSRNLSCRGRTGVGQFLSSSFRGCLIVGYQIAGPSKKLQPGHRDCYGELRHAGPYCRCADDGGPSA